MKWLTFLNTNCEVKLKKVKDRIYIFFITPSNISIGPDSEFGTSLDICNKENSDIIPNWQNFIYNQELNVWYRPLGSLTINQILPFFQDLTIAEKVIGDLEVRHFGSGVVNEHKSGLSNSILSADGVEPTKSTTEDSYAGNVGAKPTDDNQSAGRGNDANQIDLFGERAGHAGRTIARPANPERRNEPVERNSRASGNSRQINSSSGIAPPQSSTEVTGNLKGSTGNWIKKFPANTNFASKNERIEKNIEALRLVTNSSIGNLSGNDLSAIDAFSGWGGLADEIVRGDVMGKVSDFLNDSQIKTIKTSALYGYFTSDKLVKSIWDWMSAAGYSGGRVMEPSCATGKFISNRNVDFDNFQHFTGIEIDKTSANIAKALHPQSLILDAPFEKVYADRLDDGSFDFVIGNFPFGEQKIIDKSGEALSIHNYFLLKNLALLRKGGIMTIITSTHTLDSKNEKFRNIVAQDAQLLSAIRLPSGTFEGTGVVSDLLVFRKKTGDEKDLNYQSIPFEKLGLIKLPAERAFATLVDNKTKFIEENELLEIPINEAFLSSSPNAILCGEASTALIGMGSRPGLILKGNLSNVIGAIENLKSNSPRWFDNQNLYLKFGPPDLKEEFNFESDRPQYIGNLIVRNNSVYSVITIKQQTSSNWLLKCDPIKISSRGLLNHRNEKLNPTDVIRDYVSLRDTALDLLKAESANDGNESEATKLRQLLNNKYDGFVRNHGYINEKGIRRLIRRDALIGVGLSLEHWDRDSQTATKADIFTRKFTLISDTRVDNLNLLEAVSVSFSELGRVDVGMIEELSGRNIQDLVKETPGVLFKDPVSGQYEHKSKYLVGNVIEKIELAEKASLIDSSYLSNVKSLNEVKPPYIPARDIGLSVGAKWIPDSIIKAYIHSVYKGNGVEVKVNLSRPSGDVSPRLSISVSSGSYAGFDLVSRITHGTKDILFRDVLLSLMTSTPIVVKKQTTNGTLVDTEATITANNKVEFVRDDFTGWVLRNQDIVNEIETIYNTKVNVYNYEVDLSDINYEFKGMNPDWKPKKHQIEFVLKALIHGNMLNADCVGAGKTGMQAMLAHELKRLGLARLPFIVVPNHILYQTAASAQNIFPNARICIVTKEDFNRENRSAFIAKAAMNEWDFGVITYAMYQQLMPNSEYLAEKIRFEIEELEAALRETSTSGDRLSSRSILLKLRDAESKLENLMEDLQSNRFPLELGHSKIDAVLYDEFHKLKNLSLNMVKAIPGINSIGSNIAFIENIKMQYLMETYYKGREFGVFGFTATPVSNSLAELYSIFRMLKPSLLKNEGISNFNDWAAQYAEVNSKLEVLPEGKGFQMKARLSTFKNLPELLAGFRTFCQIHTREQLNLPVPSYEEKTITTEPNIWQQYIFDTLVKRAKGLRTKSVDSSEDNFLNIVNDAAMAAVSHHALFPLIPLPDLHTKLDAVCEKFFDVYKRTKETLGTQLIFLDKSVPSGTKWNAYQYCKDKLIKLGVPEFELAFIHDCETDDERADLFSKIRKGIVRGCFGSTEKLGTGTDVQDMLIAIHDVDIPWTPKELEQRLGRLVRQGNTNGNVFIFRYTTKGSFDVFRLETIKRKAIMISAAFSSPRTATRRFEEETEIDYDTIIAETTDNPIIKEKAKLDSKLQILQKKADDFESNLYRARLRAREHESDVNKYSPLVDKLSSATQRVHGFLSDKRIPPPPAECSEAGLKRHQMYGRLIQASFTTFGVIEGVQEGPTTWIDIEAAREALEKVLQVSMDSNSKPIEVEVYGESAALRRTWVNLYNDKIQTDHIRYYDKSITDADRAFFLADYYAKYDHSINNSGSMLFRGVMNLIPVDVVDDLKSYSFRLQEAKGGLMALSNIDFDAKFPQMAELQEVKTARVAIEAKIVEIMKAMDEKEASRPISSIKEVLRAFKRSGYDPAFNPYQCSVDSDLDLEIIDLDESNFSVVKSETSSLSLS